MHIWLSILVWSLIAGGLARWRLSRRYSPVPTSLEGARQALAFLGDCAKWMSGIQTATLGGVIWLLFEQDVRLSTLGPWQLWFGIGSFVFTALALFCCAWVLSAIPSVASRLHGMQQTAPDGAFDAHEATMFAAPSPRLGNMMALQHWLWAGGLVCIGLVVVLELSK